MKLRKAIGFDKLVPGRIYDVHVTTDFPGVAFDSMILRSVLVKRITSNIFETDSFYLTALVVSDGDVNEFDPMKRYIKKHMYFGFPSCPVTDSGARISMLEITNMHDQRVYFVRKSKRCLRSKMLMEIDNLIDSYAKLTGESVSDYINSSYYDLFQVKTPLAGACNLINIISMKTNKMTIIDSNNID